MPCIWRGVLASRSSSARRSPGAWRAACRSRCPGRSRLSGRACRSRSCCRSLPDIACSRRPMRPSPPTCPTRRGWGSPTWPHPQAAVLSPIAMLGRVLPLEHFLLGMLAVKILLAFEGCWLLARALGAGRFSAVLGAGGFALGGPVLAWAVFPLSSVVAWSPWLALGTLRVVRRPSPRHVIAAALVFAALQLSGHPEG